VKYNCENKASDFTILNPDKSYPAKYDYYWHISNFTDKMDKYKIILAVEEAFKIWQRGLDLVKPTKGIINLVSTDDINKADIIISFGKDMHEFTYRHSMVTTCPFPLDHEGGTLAHAWSLATVAPFGGQLHLDDSENWGSMRKPGNIHLLTVLIHEIGHVLDIGHSHIREAVMYAGYTGIKTNLHVDDMKALQKRFGPIKEKLYQNLKKKPWWRLW